MPGTSGVGWGPVDRSAPQNVAIWAMVPVQGQDGQVQDPQWSPARRTEDIWGCWFWYQGCISGNLRGTHLFNNSEMIRLPKTTGASVSAIGIENKCEGTHGQCEGLSHRHGPMHNHKCQQHIWHIQHKKAWQNQGLCRHFGWDKLRISSHQSQRQRLHTSVCNMAKR